MNSLLEQSNYPLFSSSSPKDPLSLEALTLLYKRLTTQNQILAEYTTFLDILLHLNSTPSLEDCFIDLKAKTFLLDKLLPGTAKRILISKPKDLFNDCLNQIILLWF